MAHALRSLFDESESVDDLRLQAGEEGQRKVSHGKMTKSDRDIAMAQYDHKTPLDVYLQQWFAERERKHLASRAWIKMFQYRVAARWESMSEEQKQSNYLETLFNRAATLQEGTNDILQQIHSLMHGHSQPPPPPPPTPMQFPPVPDPQSMAKAIQVMRNLWDPHLSSLPQDEQDAVRVTMQWLVQVNQALGQ